MRANSLGKNTASDIRKQDFVQICCCWKALLNTVLYGSVTEPKQEPEPKSEPELELQNFFIYIFYFFALGGSPTPHPISLPTSFCM